jgi:sugar lactone lactonase YvrE
MNQSVRQFPTHKLLISLTIGSLLPLLLVGCAAIQADHYDAPNPPRLEGVLTPNRELTGIPLLAYEKIKAPETIAVDDDGKYLYTGSALDGKIWQLNLSPEAKAKLAVYANPGGCSLGMCLDKTGSLIVCHKSLGLLSIAKDGKVTVLTNEAGGKPIGYANDLAVAHDGKIYFSDASDKFYKGDSMTASGLDMLEARPHGRLLVYDPADKTTKVLLDKLYFANGVTLSCQQDYVLVAETFRYRIRRYWLKGPRQGTHDLFVENLPGTPDGIRTSARCTYWVALPAKRSALLDNLHKNVLLKELISALPPALWLHTDRYGLVVEIDQSGKIVRSLHDQTGRIYMISSVTEHDGKVYLGCIRGSGIGCYELPATKPKKIGSTDGKPKPNSVNEHSASD